MIFSIFRFFCTLRFQIFSQILSKPYINGNIIYSVFQKCIRQLTFYDCICAPGSHIYIYIYVCLVDLWIGVILVCGLIFMMFADGLFNYQFDYEWLVCIYVMDPNGVSVNGRADSLWSPLETFIYLFTERTVFCVVFVILLNSFHLSCLTTDALILTSL